MKKRNLVLLLPAIILGLCMAIFIVLFLRKSEEVRALEAKIEENTKSFNNTFRRLNTEKKDLEKQLMDANAALSAAEEVNAARRNDASGDGEAVDNSGGQGEATSSNASNGGTAGSLQDDVKQGLDGKGNTLVELTESGNENGDSSGESKEATQEQESGAEGNAYEGTVLTAADILASPAGRTFAESVVDTANIGQYFTVSEIPRDGEVFNRINGRSYRDNPDIALEQLRYLKVLHWNYDGVIQAGELVCNVAVSDSLRNIFLELFVARFQIYSMYLVDKFWTGDGLTTDEASVRANNTSAFNYRRASDAANLSNHAFGKAIDVNPRDNPYIALGGSGWYTDPHIDYAPGEEAYANPDARNGMQRAFKADGIVVQTFKRYGFTWGGDWGGNSRDYQHFERLG